MLEGKSEGIIIEGVKKDILLKLKLLIEYYVVSVELDLDIINYLLDKDPIDYIY
jgi:hypothetical protein